MLVDKPSGVTSHDVVDVVRRSLRTRKVGHAGTLDPMATGLLILGVGRATRLLRYLGDLSKSYAATGRLGEETDTLDADGQIVRSASVDVSRAEIEEACAALVGDSLQTPPAYSAVKVGGRKLYEAARKGDALEAPARRIASTRSRCRRSAGETSRFGSPARAARTYASSWPTSVVRSCGAPRAPSPNRDRALPGRGRPPGRVAKPFPIERAVEHLPSVHLDAEEALAASHGRLLGPAAIDGPVRGVRPRRCAQRHLSGRGSERPAEVVLAPDR